MIYIETADPKTIIQTLRGKVFFTRKGVATMENLNDNAFGMVCGFSGWDYLAKAQLHVENMTSIEEYYTQQCDSDMLKETREHLEYWTQRREEILFG